MITYEYNLYSSKRNRKIDAMLRECCFVWNHALALQRRYYRIYKGYINLNKMQKHFAKRIPRYLLHSQTTQEIIARLDATYIRFFNHLSKRPPKFRKTPNFRCFVYKQGGYKLNSNVIVLNTIKQHFQFSYSRPYEGNIKNVRIRRNPSGTYSLYLVTDASPKPHRKTHDGASVGLDFGLKHFLTLSDGTIIDNPQFLKTNLKKLKKLSQKLSKSTKGSNCYKKNKQALAKLHRRIANMRKDWHWKLAHKLCREYDVICIEDLQIQGMYRRWGRKMCDYSWASFVDKLEQVARKYEVSIKKVERFYPSSKTCSSCGYIYQGLSIKERSWICPQCRTHHDRDLNAAKNILRQGIASSKSVCKTKSSLR